MKEITPFPIVIDIMVRPALEDTTKEIKPFAMSRRLEALHMFHKRHKRELDDLPNDVQQVMPNTIYQLVLEDTIKEITYSKR